MLSLKIDDDDEDDDDDDDDDDDEEDDGFQEPITPSVLLIIQNNS